MSAPAGYHQALNRAVFASLPAFVAATVETLCERHAIQDLDGCWLQPHHRLGLLLLPEGSDIGYAIAADGSWRKLTAADFE